MAETTNYQCPNCGGQLGFVGKTGMLHCEFCDSDFTPAQVEAIYAERQAKADARAAQEKAREEGAGAAAAPTPKGATAAEASTSEGTRVHVHRSTATDPVQAYLENSRWDDADAENLRAYNCSSCGAQLMVDQVTAVTRCPYCGNNAVLPGQLSDMLKPDWVIPFKLGKEDAVAALNNYYKGKRYLPDSFTDTNHIEEIQGVYVPFWLYSGKTKGDMRFKGERVLTWSDDDYNYTQTDFYDIHRAGSMDFVRVPVDGSTRMPDEHMDAIEPFDYAELTEFSVAYLPGYVTDRYDLDVKECDARARTRVEATCEDKLRDSVSGYTFLRTTHSDISAQWTNIGYALLPVWMLHTRWNDQDYLFAMNGQTGKLIGDLPVDKTKMLLHFLIIFAAVLIPIVLVIQFLFGGYLG
ncbi:MAG: hypothetical protein Q4B54_04180 [Coriobacteriales bacterium]|nr:hypothetical protein [Coriobacteriales bacterium]